MQTGGAESRSVFDKLREWIEVWTCMVEYMRQVKNVESDVGYFEVNMVLSEELLEKSVWIGIKGISHDMCMEVLLYTISNSWLVVIWSA